MRRRLDPSQSVIAPWHIPDIAAPTQQVPIHDFLEMEFGHESSAAELAPAADVSRASVRATDQTGEMPAQAGDPRASPGYAEAYALGMAEGRARGYPDGIAAGRQVADSQFADEIRRLDAVVRRVGEPIRSLERPVEDAVIALALEVARWVIGSEVARSRDYLVRLIRDAVAKVPIDVGPSTIFLNPADLEPIRRMAPDLEHDGVAIVADEEIEAGGCRVVADDGNGVTRKDRRWHPGALRGVCEVDLTLASRWRDAMFAMFEGEDT